MSGAAVVNNAHHPESAHGASRNHHHAVSSSGSSDSLGTDRSRDDLSHRYKSSITVTPHQPNKSSSAESLLSSSSGGGGGVNPTSTKRQQQQLSRIQEDVQDSLAIANRGMPPQQVSNAFVSARAKVFGPQQHHLPAGSPGGGEGAGGRSPPPPAVPPRPTFDSIAVYQHTGPQPLDYDASFPYMDSSAGELPLDSPVWKQRQQPDFNRQQPGFSDQGRIQPGSSNSSSNIRRQQQPSDRSRQQEGVSDSRQQSSGFSSTREQQSAGYGGDNRQRTVPDLRQGSFSNNTGQVYKQQNYAPATSWQQQQQQEQQQLRDIQSGAVIQEGQMTGAGRPIRHESYLTAVHAPQPKEGVAGAEDQPHIVYRTRDNAAETNAKLARRTSYLMATGLERPQITLTFSNTSTHLTTIPGTSDVIAAHPSDVVVTSLGEDPASSASVAAQQQQQKFSTPQAKGNNLRKIKAFFGERTPRVLAATAEGRMMESDMSSSSQSGGETWDMEGALHCKILVQDGKRSTDRSWKAVNASLRGTLLYLSRPDKKDKDSQQQGAGEEQQAVVLGGCIIDIAHTYTKKKNVLRLTTANESEYLFHTEEHPHMIQWIMAIRRNCGHTDELPETLRAEIAAQQHNKDKTKKQTKLSHSPSVSRKKLISEESPKASKEGGRSWRGRMKGLKKTSSSLTAQSPSENNEGQAFAIPLEDCVPCEENDFVPLLVEVCVKIVEARGLEMTGIYRVPGNTASVTALQELLNKGLDNISTDDERWLDLNVICSLLKTFFRRLPDPLITSELYQAFIQANRTSDPMRRMLTIKKLVHELPEHHFETLHYLVRHLRNIADKEDVNKMDARNLAIVFGPTLIRTSDDNMVSLVTDMSDQCRIVESIIAHCSWFFSSWEEDSYVPVDGENSAPISTGQPSRRNSENVNPKELVGAILKAARRTLQKRDSGQSEELLDSPPPPARLRYEERDIDAAIEERKASLEDMARQEDGRLQEKPQNDGGRGEEPERRESSSKNYEALMQERREEMFAAKMSFLNAPQPGLMMRSDMGPPQSFGLPREGRGQASSGRGSALTREGRRHSEDTSRQRSSSSHAAQRYPATLVKQQAVLPSADGPHPHNPPDYQAHLRRSQDRPGPVSRLPAHRQGGGGGGRQRDPPSYASPAPPPQQQQHAHTGYGGGGGEGQAVVTSDVHPLRQSKSSHDLSCGSGGGGAAAPPPDFARHPSLPAHRVTGRKYTPPSHPPPGSQPPHTTPTTTTHSQPPPPSRHPPSTSQSRPGRAKQEPPVRSQVPIGKQMSWRFGSLDSLRDIYTTHDSRDSLWSSGTASEEDMLETLTSAFDAKMTEVRDQQPPGQPQGQLQPAVDLSTKRSNDQTFSKAFRDPGAQGRRGDPQVGIASRIQRTDVIATDNRALVQPGASPALPAKSGHSGGNNSRTGSTRSGSHPPPSRFEGPRHSGRAAETISSRTAGDRREASSHHQQPPVGYNRRAGSHPPSSLVDSPHLQPRAGAADRYGGGQVPSAGSPGGSRQQQPPIPRRNYSSDCLSAAYNQAPPPPPQSVRQRGGGENASQGSRLAGRRETSQEVERTNPPSRVAEGERRDKRRAGDPRRRFDRRVSAENVLGWRSKSVSDRDRGGEGGEGRVPEATSVDHRQHRRTKSVGKGLGQDYVDNYVDNPRSNNPQPQPRMRRDDRLDQWSSNVGRTNCNNNKSVAPSKRSAMRRYGSTDTLDCKSEQERYRKPEAGKRKRKARRRHTVTGGGEDRQVFLQLLASAQPPPAPHVAGTSSAWERLQPEGAGHRGNIADWLSRQRTAKGQARK